MRIPAKVVKDMERRKKAFITDGRSRKFIEECVADGQREVTKDPPTFQEICDSAPPPVRKTIENPECIHGIIQYSVICLKCNPEPEHVKQATPVAENQLSQNLEEIKRSGRATLKEKCEAQEAHEPAPPPVVDEEAEKGQPDTRTIQEVLRLHVTSSGSMESTYRDTANSDMLQWQEGFTEGLKRAIEVADNLAVRTEAARAVWSEAADKCVDIAKAIVENHPDSIQFSAADGALACERAFRKLAASAPAKEPKT